MTSDELYLAISELINSNSKELEHRIDAMEDRLTDRIEQVDAKIDMVEIKLSNRIDDVESKLSNRIDDVETKLSNRIDHTDTKVDSVEKRLGDQIHSIKLYLENNISPRLQNIEMCYMTTYDKYKENTEKFERMQLDIEVLKSVVRKHDEMLCVAPA